MFRRISVSTLLLSSTLLGSTIFGCLGAVTLAEEFSGRYYRGAGDLEYLQLLDTSRRVFSPDVEFQNVPMLYTPVWNGFVEGPTWDAWWIQNSYGTTYCALPFFEEPSVTFLQNAQDLWFDQMGDGKRAGVHGWIAPDGCLCDAAQPDRIFYKQGDGRIDIHDWGMEFTAAGLLMQSELLLISRDRAAIDRYLPKLRRCAEFIESRRDPKNNLFLAGPAGNLLAPSYAGWKRPDGAFDKAYLTGLSITYIAALDRLIELEKMARNTAAVNRHTERRESARKGLANVTGDEGYFFKYIDPDGTRHGDYEKKHGYFETVCNHDAVCFRVADDSQARKIYAKMNSISGLRPHALVITNYPTLDDMYVPDTDWLWSFGVWVNGGHWSTCEARMIMGYYRLGMHEDARRSMRQLMKFARAFRMDNPLVDFGNAVYQPGEAINLCYDSFGPPAAMVRGLFEYLYKADSLTLLPHIPPTIARLEQDFPIRFGSKRLYLATAGSGPITAVTINGQRWQKFDAQSLTLPYDETPERAVIGISLGGAPTPEFEPSDRDRQPLPNIAIDEKLWGPERFPVISVNKLPLRIGADSSGNNRFRGDIRRARVFGRALTAEEIAELARDKPGKLDTDASLIGDWTFDKRQENEFPNAAKEGMPAKFVGKVEVVDSPAGKAVRLGAQGYLEVSPDARLDLTRACTLDAWVCPEKLPASGARIIDKSGVGTSNAYLLDTNPGNSLRIIVERGTLTHDAQLTPGRWTHVAATANVDGTLSLYADGQRVLSKTFGPPVDLAALTQRIGRIRGFHAALLREGMPDSYEASHAKLVLECFATWRQRLTLLDEGKLSQLPAPSLQAADMSYLTTAIKFCDGLEKQMDSYGTSAEAAKKKLHQLWKSTASQ